MKRSRSQKIRKEDLPDMVTPEEGRRFLRLSRNAMYARINDGRIPAVKYGRLYRIPKSALIN